MNMHISAAATDGAKECAADLVAYLLVTQRNLAARLWAPLNSASKIANGSAPDKPVHRNATARIFDIAATHPARTVKRQHHHEHQSSEANIPL